MTGPRRLAIFLSALWIVICLVLEALEPYEWHWVRLALMGGVPVGLPWGIWWVVRGFRP